MIVQLGDKIGSACQTSFQMDLPTTPRCSGTGGVSVRTAEKMGTGFVERFGLGPDFWPYDVPLTGPRLPVTKALRGNGNNVVGRIENACWVIPMQMQKLRHPPD